MHIKIAVLTLPKEEINTLIETYIQIQILWNSRTKNPIDFVTVEEAID